MNPYRTAAVSCSSLITLAVVAHAIVHPFSPWAAAFAALMWGGTFAIFELTRKIGAD